MILKAVLLKNLKKGSWFTRNPIEYPSDRQVFIRDDYNRSEGRFECVRYSDINDYILLKGDTIVYTDFIF